MPVARAALLALLVVGIAVAATPSASARYDCEWDLGPVRFACSGEGGCAPVAGFTPQGAAFVGCAAWD